MADERSTRQTHADNKDQLDYDESYYDALSDYGLIKGDVLDIGAGALMFVKRYISDPKVTSVLAIDKHQEDYQAAKLKLKSWQMPDKLPDGKFDTIVSTEFIEHITRKHFGELLPQIKDRLAKGGNFVGSTPNKVAPTTNPYHLYEYTLDELKDILELNFKSVQIWDTGKYCTVWVASGPR
jgi:2-polyprenyl-3-methyl-5-hydroxy-6-metoxy-1,4-benzoquinol methylase